MKVHTQEMVVRTRGKGTYEISDEIAAMVRTSGVTDGQVTVFLRHTSASLILMENADPSARRDLERWFDRLVREDDPDFIHTHEGADDMPSHIRMALTRSSEVIPVHGGRMVLGTWQGIFVFEHRRQEHSRRIAVTVMGV
ncbi:MAG: secondary thiamine-phosphate synthase enzyme YjbQ [Akkermansiaceae bacterium]|jgi:secondary thiamine-phosphate synthase enzyme|nr:secondary thiamine-phosphate synthase enzyme YjbQ [Akkermansiaceae bacterium]MDP4647277.1 secondary thiamine-phosphate synthase enzyme YjbQ [Akkermansiaceae bacterium]MDP4722497.1 secondary thiamine-phosphate synthase enzyme YjbQ [Akkermansiaceae bacterium]MDP4781057.1 secondary thiamine-phosphate synthase enzyme YjbQ [Akkermansiaceae bacterium]MDP4848509.1 secondary thiamine-phosphate synthase enzyme YjbQ [Akkermansiaceae bacterium]